MTGSVIAPYGDGGASARVRVFEWLRRLGVDADVYSYRSDTVNNAVALLSSPAMTLRAERALRQLDVEDGWLLLHREASPFSHGRLERDLLATARHSAYDLDDALFADRVGWRRVLGKRPKAESAAAAATCVIAGNAYLADWASTFNVDVRIIPSCVDPLQAQPKLSYELQDTPTVVWVGSPSTEHHLLEWGAGIAAALRRRGARLVVVSAGRQPLGPLEEMAERIAWSPEAEQQAIAGADVGLMPLPDTDYTRGKCGYKLLLYGRSALPMVGSPVGVNAAILETCGGLAPETDAEWDDAISELLAGSCEQRRQRGATARETVCSHYSYDRWADEWCDAVGIAR